MNSSSKSKAFVECCKISDLATPARYPQSDYKSSKPDLFMEKVFYEDTVWVETVHLKNQINVFDLRKLSCRCFILGPKLKEWRNECKLTQNQVVKNLKLAGRFQLMDFERGEVGVPLNLLFKFATLYDKKKEFEEILPKLYFSRKRNEVVLPSMPEQIDGLIQYLKPIHRNVVKVSLRASREELIGIENIFDVKINYLKSLRTINSRALVDFLDTFYKYKKKCKLKFPLTRLVPDLVKMGIDLRKAIILPLLQSDGSADKKSFWMNGICRPIHDVFADAVYYTYGIVPSGYFFDSNRVGCYKTYFPSKKIILELKSLCGNTKTEPAKGQSKEDFLKEPQPHMDYMADLDNIGKRTALRCYASSEGYIGHTGKNPKFEIACANPALIKGVKKLAEDLGITMGIQPAKYTWSGIGRLSTGKVKNIERFKEIGGFIEGMTINGVTKYLRGVEKNKVLAVALKYNHQIIRNTKKERPSKQVLDLVNSTFFS